MIVCTNNINSDTNDKIKGRLRATAPCPRAQQPFGLRDAPGDRGVRDTSAWPRRGTLYTTHYTLYTIHYIYYTLHTILYYTILYDYTKL